MDKQGCLSDETDWKSVLLLRGKNRFRVATGNLADGDPADPANQRAYKECDRSQRNDSEKSQNKGERTIQNFTGTNKPARSMFVDGAISYSMSIEGQPN
jgi:hypothetical protein